MGLSPFHLAYTSEAMLPIETTHPNLMTKAVKTGYNKQILQNDKALIDNPRL